jgi:peptide-methionine (S)-S-oxide reductase
MEKATFAGGCFWCTEAIFNHLIGVISVIPGYAGGEGSAPTYEQVSTGASGFAEAIQITFDPSQVTFTSLLNIFFKTHDPTSCDSQGADRGPQYRSIVFFHTDNQRKEVTELIKKLDESFAFSAKIVTEVKPYTTFFEAESYHKNFYEKNKEYPYCRLVINPKLEKLFAEFKDQIKKE